MSKANHLYLVFNPMINKGGNYKTQAHEFYAELKRKGSNFNGDDAFLYWGKLKVNTDSEDEILKYKEVIANNEKNGEDTHLYISDYHHFWVAKVESVQRNINSPDHTIPFYDNKDVDVWFKITDMDLVSAEFEETLYYLSQLSVDNPYQSQKIDSIHPYLGGLKFPMVVEDNLNEKYFKNLFFEDSLRLSKQNPLIEKSLMLDHVSSHMKSFVLPPQVFSKLSHQVRTELLAVEMSLTGNSTGGENQHIEVLGSYLRILESVMNETIGKLASDYFGNCLFICHEGEKFCDHKTEDNSSIREFYGQASINAYVNLLTNVGSFGNLSLDNFKAEHSELIDYFQNNLVPFIRDEELVDLRSAFKTGQEVVVSKERVFFLRNKILGVGCVGVINNLFERVYASEKEYHIKIAG